MTYTDTIKALSPIAYWPLAEPSGSVATDESGNGRSGAYMSVTLGVTGIGDGRTAAAFNGTTSRNNVYSASLAGAFNKDEGTIALWIQVANGWVWTDAADRRALLLGADTNNRIFVQKNAAVNQLSVQYVAGGTIKVVSVSSFSPLTWFHVALTWSKAADQVKFYLNGAQSGATQTALGTWAGALASGAAFVGCGSGPGNFMSGNLAHAAVWSSPLSAAQIATLGNLGQPTALRHTLDRTGMQTIGRGIA